MRAHIDAVPTKIAGRAVLKVHGELDLASSDLLAAELRKLDDCLEVVVDLRAVTFLDSCGLAVLVHHDTRMANLQRGFVLVVGDGQVRRLLELTGLVDELTIISGLGELPQALTSRPASAEPASAEVL